MERREIDIFGLVRFPSLLGGDDSGNDDNDDDDDAGGSLCRGVCLRCEAP